MFFHYIITTSPIGSIEIVSDETHICGLNPTNKKVENQDLMQMPSIIQQCVQELDEYFSGERKNFSLSLSQKGTDFQQSVWNELQKIPYGETISYKTLAQRTKSPKAVRAAGSANGRNNISIIVPCHRVINTDSKLGGYAHGLEMKEYLLNLEKKNS